MKSTETDPDKDNSTVGRVNRLEIKFTRSEKLISLSQHLIASILLDKQNKFRNWELRYHFELRHPRCVCNLKGAV